MFVTFASSPRFSTRCLSRYQSQNRSLLRHTSALSPLDIRLSAYRSGGQFTGEDVSDTWDLFNLYELSLEPVVRTSFLDRQDGYLATSSLSSASTRSRFVSSLACCKRNVGGYTMKFIPVFSARTLLNRERSTNREMDSVRRNFGSDHLFGFLGSG